MKHISLLRLSLFVTLVFGVGNLNAQLVNCNVFLQGSHMEIGINSNGAFGSSAAAPTGYHPDVSDTLYNVCTSTTWELPPEIGFVVDAAEDGWTTGTPPYYGDFIMPGNPREGWAISDSDTTASAYSYYFYLGPSGYRGPLSGTNTAYTASGGTLAGTWSGMFHDSLAITQTTTIDTGNLFLIVHVGFRNIGTVTTDSFYYLRAINPHTDEISSGGGPGNLNKVEHQMPDVGNLSVVSATGTTDTNAYLALGTNDPRAKCFIVKDSTLPGPGTLASMYAGDTAHYQYSGSLTGNQGLGLVFKISLGPGDSTYLEYGYSFKASIIDTILDTLLAIDTTTVVDTTGDSTGTGTDSSYLYAHNLKAANAPAIYPNPTNDLVNITGLNPGDKTELFDIIGKPVEQNELSTLQGINKLSVGYLPPGVYILIIRDANGNVRSRFHVQKL